MILVKLPAKVASAFSSSPVKSSKKFSTLAALLVPKPKSISAAPSVNAPLGISNKPEPIPANIDSSVPTLLVPKGLPPKLLFLSLAIPPIDIPTRPPFFIAILPNLLNPSPTSSKFCTTFKLLSGKLPKYLILPLSLKTVITFASSNCFFKTFNCLPISCLSEILIAASLSLSKFNNSVSLSL